MVWTGRVRKTGPGKRRESQVLVSEVCLAGPGEEMRAGARAGGKWP